MLTIIKYIKVVLQVEGEGYRYGDMARDNSWGNTAVLELASSFHKGSNDEEHIM